MKQPNRKKRQNEIEALQSQQRLEFERGHPILDSIADGVFTIDRNRRITSFNRAAEQITGFDRDHVIGKQCSEIFKANICEHYCALLQTIETGQELVNIPIEIQNRKGEHIPVSISTAVLHDRSGKHIGGVETFRDLTALAELRKQIDNRFGIEDIVGHHPKIKEILEILPEVASSDATVLLLGPSGSGKSLLAKAIHDLSQRREKPFIKVNCSALPETLLESELFGYVKGAFTDAKKDKLGRIALAEGGTLFLDEIGDVSSSVQVKLLRVVQEREYEPLGDVSTQIADVRVLAATNRDLAQMMEEGTFRQDLYYRLNIVGLTLPSLAERRDDIPRLADRFLRRLNAKMDKYISAFSEEAMEALMQHSYPGNVRELENAIEHAMVLCRGSVIEKKHLPASLQASSERKNKSPIGPLHSAEAQTIRETLKQHNGNRTEAARALGLHRSTLWRKMQRYGLGSGSVKQGSADK